MKFKKLPVSDLFVDDNYQRPLRPARVKSIAKDFRPAQLGVLEVSQRGPNEYAVFDGQHRLAVLNQLGRATAPCLVHENLSPEDEAVLFVRHQVDRKSVSPVERFRAEVFSEDDEACAIESICSSYGFTVADRHDAGEQHVIRAVKALRSVLKRHGIIGLEETLNLLKHLWWGDAKSTDGHLIEGLAELWAGYGNRLDDQALARLSTVAPVTILRRALGPMSGGGSGASRHLVLSELRKAAGVRGRPSAVPPRVELALVEPIAA